MIGRLASGVMAWRGRVLLGALAFLLVAGAVGGSVAEHLSSGGFADPNAESSRAVKVLSEQFHAGDPNLVLLVTATAGSVDAGGVPEAGQALTKELQETAGINQAVSYWSLGSPPPLRSKDGRQALVLARIGGNDDEVRARIKKLSPPLTRSTPVMSVAVGGQAELFRQVGTQIQDDLKIAELIALPITLVLLVLVFGSVVAASLPLAVGVLAIIGSFLLLRIIGALTQVSIFSLNLVTGMGLGLAIDYSLFVLARYREELARGLRLRPAIVRAVETAGRTVVFSAVTVAVSLSALLLFPLAFLRSFAFAGIAVTALAALGAIVVLPALLALLGPRIDKLQLLKRPPRDPDAEGTGFWHRAALLVMRRPIGIGTAVIVILVLLGSPFFGIKFGLPDDRVLPKSSPGRHVQDEIRSNFSSQEAFALAVVARDSGNPATRTAEIGDYATRLSRLPGVARVDALTGSYLGGRQVFPATPASARFYSVGGTWLSVVPAVEPMSGAAERLVRAVRHAPAPFAIAVSGSSAQLVDSKHSIFGRLPIALGLIALVSFVALFLMFGSLLVPAKAVVLNLLSLTATFGAMVWIFQQGHLSGFLNFTPTGLLDTTTPVLMFCVAFGLSMDYEVFLLSRIKEEYDRTGDNVHSVAVGLERTGGIVTAIAALIAVVFISFATSKITFIKLFGVGMTMAVLMDATLIRAILVPAFMRLAGAANWWAPRPLRRVYDRFGISDIDAEYAGLLQSEIVGAADR
jgi:RND superfamily putative drug exporter